MSQYRDRGSSTDLDDGQPVADDGLDQRDEPRHEEDAANDARQVSLRAALRHGRGTQLRGLQQDQYCHENICSLELPAAL